MELENVWPRAVDVSTQQTEQNVWQTVKPRGVARVQHKQSRMHFLLLTVT